MEKSMITYYRRTREIGGNKNLPIDVSKCKEEKVRRVKN